MANKPTYEELEKRVRELEKEAIKYKKVQAALQESETLRNPESRLKALSDASFEAIFLSDKGICLDQNQTAARMFGYTHAEAVGRHGTEWIAPENREQVKNNMMSGYEKPYEVTARRKDGTTFPAEIQARMINIEGCDIRVTALRDITEHKQAKEKLRNSEIKRRILIEQSSDGIVVLNQNGKVYEANKRYAEMLGYSLEEVNELHVWDWDIQWTKEQLLAMIHEVDETGDHFETRHRRKDGTFLDVEISTNGAVFGGQKLVFCVCRDITKRKQAEENLRKLHEELEHRVEKRTRELAATNRKLQENTLNLKEANTALKVLLRRREEDQAEVEERILANVSELIIPAIDILKGTKIDDRQANWIDILETNIREIVSPFSHGLSSKHLRLTPMEFRVANFIKNDKTTKEIAELLHVATSTVNTYRDNIRKKLGIKNRKINLKTYLLDLK